MLRIPGSISNIGGSGMGLGSMIGGAIGSIGSAIFDRNTARRDAERANSWSKMMSDTAHQREVEDLKKAGLNPILSAGGGGASSPSAQTPSAPKMSLPDIAALTIQQQQLKNDTNRVAIEQANSAAGIAKNLTEQEINKMKKLLMQKGMIRAEAEGRFFKFLDDSFKKGNDTKKKLNAPPSGAFQWTQKQLQDAMRGMDNFPGIQNLNRR